MDRWRLSRHAKNNLRQYRLTVADLEAALSRAVRIGQDADGNPRLEGLTSERRLRIVIARDDPHFVITVFMRRR